MELDPVDEVEAFIQRRGSRQARAQARETRTRASSSPSPRNILRMSGTMCRKVAIRSILPTAPAPSPQYDDDDIDTPVVKRARRTPRSYTDVDSNSDLDDSDLDDSESDIKATSDYSDASDSDEETITLDDSDSDLDEHSVALSEISIDVAVIPTGGALTRETTAVAGKIKTDSTPAGAWDAHAPAAYHIWTPEDQEKLESAVKKVGKKWVLVAALVPGRTNEQCRKRWIAAPSREQAKMSIPRARADCAPRNEWTPEEDIVLKSAVKKRGTKWVEVAALVPDRNHHQCRKRWYGHGHLGLDASAKSCGLWTAAEDARLTAAVKKHGEKKWSVVAPLVRGRTNEQCRRRWLDVMDLNTLRVTGKWTATEDAKLTTVVKTHGDTNWVKVAALVPGRSYLQCRQRWIRYLTKSDLTMGQFTAEEDVKLTAAVLKHGIKNWIAVAEMVPHRSFQQCRNRWCRAFGLNDRAKGMWTAAEDAKLTAAVKKYGDGDNDNWFAVAEHVPGRTYLQCRQRWSRSWGLSGRTAGKKASKAKARNKAGYTAKEKVSRR